MDRRPFRAAAVLAVLALIAAPAARAADGQASGVTALERLFTGLPNRIEVRDTVAYVALDTGLEIWDVSSPPAPVRLALLAVPGHAHDVFLDGTRAYLAAGEAGLYIVDVARLDAPRILGALRSDGARAVAVSGGVAWVAEAGPPPALVSGLRSIDVSDPQAPVAIGFLPMPNGALDVVLAGSTAWVALGADPARGSFGLAAVDVTDPAAPAFVPGGWLPTTQPVHDVAVAAGIAALATGQPSIGALVLADVSAPGAPRALASVMLGDAAHGVALRGSIAYVAARSLGLITLDVTDPAAPRALAWLQTGRESVGVAARGDAAFLAERSSNGTGAVLAVDTLFPASLRTLAAAPYAEATAVALAPGAAYLLRRDALHVFDASGPLLAWRSAWQPPAGDFSALAVEDGLAAVAEGPVIHLVDVTDPSAPVERGSVRVTDGTAVRVVLAGSILYAVTGLGLETFDLASPAAPGATGLLATPGWSSALAVEDGTGYLVAGDSLHVLDLTTPSRPAAVGTLRIPGELLFGVAAARPLCVLVGLAGLYTADVASAGAPLLSGSLALGPGFDVTLAGERALVAAGTRGVEVVDATDPAAPVLEAFHDTSGSAVSIAASGSVMLLATLDAQHWTLTCDTCPAGCSESWPALGFNSLRAVKTGATQVVSWALASGTGSWNLHATPAKQALPALHQDAASVVGSTTATSLADGSSPAPGGAVHYRVYGRGACTGSSYPM